MLLFAVPPALFVALFLIPTALRVVLTVLFFLGVVVVPGDGSPVVIHMLQSIREGVPGGNICVCVCVTEISVGNGRLQY